MRQRIVLMFANENWKRTMVQLTELEIMLLRKEILDEACNRAIEMLEMLRKMSENKDGGTDCEASMSICVTRLWRSRRQIELISTRVKSDGLEYASDDALIVLSPELYCNAR